MGLTTGDFPPVEPATFMQRPYRERIKLLGAHWAEYGFGAPKITGIIYIVKLLVFFTIGGICVITLTSGMSPFEPSDWFYEPVFWQKAVIWTMLLEGLGVAGSWGPLAGHFKPMTGGVLYYARVGTLRNPPWPTKVPATEGDTRTSLDVALYLTWVAGLTVALVLPGRDGVDELVGLEGVTHGLVSISPLIIGLIALALLGFRDKIAFLQTRAEQYIPALLFFCFVPWPDMLILAKVLIVIVWCGAAFSKLGKHFDLVIPPMVANTPWLSIKSIKRLHFRDYPNDMRPAKAATRLAHGAGTLVEFGMPLVLIFSQNQTLSVIAAALMIGFHLFIISTFPLAVPLEWNVLFAFLAGFLFLGYPNQDGFGITDMSAGLLIPVALVMLAFPIVGNLRPDLMSFLPSMRQYSGNWATAMWAFAPGAELKLDAGIKKPALMQRQQLVPLYGEDEAEVIMHQLLGWRSLHSQGRGLNSLMMKTIGADLDHYTPREAEFSCNALTGFNFGDGHFHDEHLIRSIQKQCHFEPGEFMVCWIESEPWGPKRGTQDYWIMDAAVGVIERGSFKVEDCVKVQPWLPDGPIPTDVTWTLDGYERVSYPPASSGQPAEGDQPEGHEDPANAGQLPALS